jgi:hypothetical protein
MSCEAASCSVEDHVSYVPPVRRPRPLSLEREPAALPMMAPTRTAYANETEEARTTGRVLDLPRGRSRWTTQECEGRQNGTDRYRCRHPPRFPESGE